MPRAAAPAWLDRARSRPRGPCRRADRAVAAALLAALALPWRVAAAGQAPRADTASPVVSDMAHGPGPTGQIDRTGGTGREGQVDGGPAEEARGTGPRGQLAPDADGVDEAAELAAAAERRLAAGATDEALALWRRAYALLPPSIGYAQRRAAVALAIAGAEEAAFRAGGEPARLHAGIAALDAYLAGLEPTDDENRAGAEARRAALSDLLEGTASPGRPRAAPPTTTPTGRRGLDRRAGLAAAGLGGAALVAGAVAVGGAMAARAADGRLADAVARPCGGPAADPCGGDATREALKAEALADGARANRIEVIGIALAGTLVAAGLAALLAAGIRGRAPARVVGRGPTLVVRF